MFDFKQFYNNCEAYTEQGDFSRYLDSCFIELENYFETLDSEHLEDIKFDIEDLLYLLEEKSLILDHNTPRINALLLLIGEQLEKAYLAGAISILMRYLPESSIKDRLNASQLYLNINDSTTGFHTIFDEVLTLITKSDNAYEYKMLHSILAYFLKAMQEFRRLNRNDLSESFKQLFVTNKNQYEILDHAIIVNAIQSVTIANYPQESLLVLRKLHDNKLKYFNCDTTGTPTPISIEQSDYSQKLYAIENINFDKIRQVAFDNGGTPGLFTQLNRGLKIIDSVPLLYQYMISYGSMHKAKLYDAYEMIVPSLKGKTINIVDWGSGQALASSLFIDYIKENTLPLGIEHISLIEPSQLALSRGLLHIDVLNSQHSSVTAIHKDLDCLTNEDLVIDNTHPTLHLFSNILDVESFKLDNIFFKKISSNFKNDNYFVCVSPNINDKRNGRLDLFFQYFDDNFNTNLNSSRDNDIGRYRRYEKIFTVDYTKAAEVTQVRESIEAYHVDVYTKLQEFSSMISPIININQLKQTIESDPDYVIFKIRKTAEIITSKIYSQYEHNENKVSQNDKIKYLSFTKKVLSRKAQSHLHTIRTIGNISAHEHLDNPTQLLKEDAEFLITALTLLMEDLKQTQVLPSSL